MPEYKNGKIYKIISNHMPDTCYIGSTTQSLCKRFGAHRRCYKQYLRDGTKYTSACKMVCYPDAKIYLIESYNCSNRNELEKREGEIMKKFMKDESLENPVNMVIAGRTSKEYYVDNQNEIKEQQKQYYKDNQEKIKEHKKQYRDNNKNKVKEQQKKHYDNNKDIINTKRKIKVNCEYCNSCVRKCDIPRHHRTMRCQSFQ